MIFFLFPVVGMYSFFLSSIFFILCSSSSFHLLATPYTSTHTHTHLSQLNSNSVSSLSFYLSLNHHKKIELAKKKRGKKKTRREYTTNSNTYTHTLFPTLTHSQQVGIETSQLSSAQLNFVIKIVKNLLRLYISLFFLGFESNRGEILVKEPLFFT